MTQERLLGVGLGIIAATTACSRAHTAPPTTSAAAVVSSPTVFNDSALHARLCVPNAPGEDWRSVCTPRDQSVRPVLQSVKRP